MKRFLSKRTTAVLILAALSIAVFAQQSTTSTDSLIVSRLKQHITYLASDKLEGRRTGSAEATLAAEYIAREFARYGLRRSIGYDTQGMSVLEADSPHRYMQEFPYVAGVALGKNNLLQITRQVTSDGPAPPQNLRAGEDWMPLGFSTNAKIEKVEIAFAGYGISSAELKYDDYAVSSAKDRIAIVFSGTPDGDNPHGQFARAGETRFKVAAARAAGARALIIIAHEPNLKDDPLSRLAYDNAGEAGIPVLVVSRQVAARLLGAADATLSEFDKIADARVVPQNGSSGSSKVTSQAIFRLPSLGQKLNVTTDVVHSEVKAYNVVGILDGSDPVLKNEVIVIGAHYDHLGRGGEGSLAPKAGEIHHGADDNASGTAGVLELARVFAEQPKRPRRTLVFICFSGEEEGLLGSNYYVNHPLLPLTSTVAMINMDMVGRMKDNKLIIGGLGTAQEWKPLIAENNKPERFNVNATGAPSAQINPVSVRDGGRQSTPVVTGINGETVMTIDYMKPFELTLNEDGFGPSDHSSFYAKQIPVLFFWTGTHSDYHKPSDTADKIDYRDEARVLAFVQQVVLDIDKKLQRPTYTVAKSESTGRSMGFRVYLGTIPNYADSGDGLLLDGVRDDSPAAKAGIKGGDRIVKLAGRDVKNVYDYTYALGEMRAGEEYEVELMRGGERLKLKITPAARK